MTNGDDIPEQWPWPIHGRIEINGESEYIEVEELAPGDRRIGPRKPNAVAYLYLHRLSKGNGTTLTAVECGRLGKYLYWLRMLDSIKTEGQMHWNQQPAIAETFVTATPDQLALLRVWMNTIARRR